MLGGGDAAARDQRDFVADPALDQIAVNGAQPIREKASAALPVLVGV